MSMCKIGYLVPRWPGSWDADDLKEVDFKTEEQYNNEGTYKYRGYKVTRIAYFEVEDVD